jgi:taurine dioxygenase
MQTTPTSLKQRRITSAVGAVIEGIDLREPLAPETVRFLRQSLLDHGVIFFTSKTSTPTC